MNDAGHTEQTRRFFDTLAADWTARYTHDTAVAARKARFLNAVQDKLAPPADILDFGCGSGDVALHLAEAGYRLTGLDLSATMIEHAQRADQARRVQWFARCHDSEVVPLADSTFDAVVASSVLEYVPALDVTLNELARLLRPGGWLFTTVPDMRDPHRQRERWLRLVLTMRGIAALAERSRWREGASYLRISINRMPAPVWQARMRACGLESERLSESTGPLLMLVARKCGQR